jgi:lipopolysaccharide/colanic/teichoic acid biosynthesis glycosyltransferase
VTPWSIRIQLALKRGLDLVTAAFGLVAFAPLLTLVGAAIKLEDRRSGLFFNDWVMGRGESRFKMLKFRTMVPHPIDYGDRPEIHGGSPLVTRVGAVLRRYKLDELPQLVNVLRGDMSLVGPRPMDPVRFGKATAFERQRLLMRPGLTGWAQVNGNIHWSWPERMQMDVWYVDRWSLLLDLRILRATLPVILGGERRGERPPERVTDDTYRVAWPGFGRHRGAGPEPQEDERNA